MTVRELRQLLFAVENQEASVRLTIDGRHYTPATLELAYGGTVVRIKGE